MPEKFDFSKSGDQKKHEDLPQEEKDKIVGEAQKEAGILNMALGQLESAEKMINGVKSGEEEWQQYLSGMGIARALSKYFAILKQDSLAAEAARAGNKAVIDWAISKEINLSDIVGHYLSHTVQAEEDTGIRDICHAKLAEFVAISYEILGSFQNAINYYMYSHLDDYKEKIISGEAGKFDMFNKIGDTEKAEEVIREKFNDLINSLSEDKSFADIKPFEKFDDLLNKAKELAEKIGEQN